MTYGKTYNKSPHRINHKATKSKTNTGTTALERSVEFCGKFFIPNYRDFGFRTFCLGSIYNVYVTFEVLERESGNIVSYAIESCFDKD